MKSYRYVPLGDAAREIRLVTLLPGIEPARIRVCLKATLLIEDVVPQFEALSYTWGSTKAPASILVGRSKVSALFVTRNLTEALRYLRYPDMPRVLWIDAICVNQQNLLRSSEWQISIPRPRGLLSG